MPVLGDLGWAESTGLSQPRWEGGLENQDPVASVSPQAFKHGDFTTGQEKLCLPWEPQTSLGSAADLQPSPSAAVGFAAGQLGNIHASHKQVKLDV